MTQGAIAPDVAGIGTVLATFASALVTVPVVARVASGSGLARQVSWSLGLVILIGGVVAVLAGMIQSTTRM